MTPFAAELIGTSLVLLIGTSVNANVSLKGTFGHEGGWMVGATGWALAVFVGVVVAGPISGAHLNPAVTIGLASAGKFPWSQVPMFVLAQMVGATLGSIITWSMYKDHFDATREQPETILGVFCTAPAIKHYPRNFISEAIGAFVLVYVIFHFQGAEVSIYSKQATTPIGMGSLGAIPVAFLVWGLGLSLGGATGNAISPARDMGPRFAHTVLPIKGKGGSNWSYSPVPVFGSIAGAVAAAMLYLHMG
ncbi:MIP/aquaporin family protein [Comamonas odontotermitis]|uniref:MIP/aquaporin family protein n=1 Tax=Comamonas odontotermitis TaxID=379895 RepID=UPI003751841A